MQLDPENYDHEQAVPETGNSLSDDGNCQGEAIGQGVWPHRRQDAERYGEHQGKAERTGPESHRNRRMIHDNINHIGLEVNRPAKIPGDGLACPIQVLHENRSVEAIVFAHILDVVL